MILPTDKTPPKPDLADHTVLIYGPSKIGKSTFCSQAEGAVFLATEPGLNALDVYQVEVDSWSKLLSAAAEIERGEHPFKVIVLDTVDNAYRLCSDYCCQKSGIDHESDLGYGKGYALVNNEFLRVLTKLAFMPFGLTLVSHSTDKEIQTRTGPITRTVPTLPEKARQIVLGLVDLVLFCDLETYQDADGNLNHRRVIRTKPSPSFDAGDRTGRLPETIDLDYGKFVAAFITRGTAAGAASM